MFADGPTVFSTCRGYRHRGLALLRVDSGKARITRGLLLPGCVSGIFASIVRDFVAGALPEQALRLGITKLKLLGALSKTGSLGTAYLPTVGRQRRGGEMAGYSQVWALKARSAREHARLPCGLPKRCGETTMPISDRHTLPQMVDRSDPQLFANVATDAACVTP